MSILQPRRNIKCPYKNVSNGFCNKNVHNIIKWMGQSKFKHRYIGRLFNEEYPPFETNEQCVQYLQEYVPRHILQIEQVLKVVINEFRGFPNPINILDIGSGPATVPLVFCRILSQHENEHKYELKITALEPKEEFCKMINIFKSENKNESIEIVDILRCSVSNYNLTDNENSYDWVIIANSISEFCENKSMPNDDKILHVNGILNELISKSLHNNKNNKLLLTIIENNTTNNYFPLVDYLKRIEKIEFNNFEVIESGSTIAKPIGIVITCEFYESDHKNKQYTPTIISRSFWFTLKK